MSFHINDFIIQLRNSDLEENMVTKTPCIGCGKEYSSAQAMENHFMAGKCFDETSIAFGEYIRVHQKAYCLVHKIIFSTRGRNSGACARCELTAAPATEAIVIPASQTDGAQNNIHENNADVANFLQELEMSPEEIRDITVEIMKNSVKTITHSSPQLRSDIKRMYTKTMDRVIQHPNNFEAHFRLSTFHKFILAHYSSDPLSEFKSQKSFTRSRMNRWANASMSEIRETIGRSRRYNATQFTPESNVWSVDPANLRKCKQYLKLGRYKDAVKALSSNGVHAINEDTKQKLLDKHPVHELPIRTNPPPPLKISPLDIKKALDNFPNGTACGPSGERAQFLINCMALPACDEFMATVTRFANLLVSGSFPNELSPIYGGATLIPLCKQDNGVRPVAIGEIWARIVGKACMARLKDKLVEAFAPFQLGVGVPNGAEAILHAVHGILQAKMDVVGMSLLTIDFRNAFNEFFRQVMFEVVSDVCPEISAWVEWKYAEASFLILPDGSVILSTAGAHQGDPLATALFSLVLNKLVKRIRDKFPELDLQVWFLDDGTVIGKTEVVRQVFELICTEGPALGLYINPDKCNLYWPIEDPAWDTFPEEVNKTTEGVKLLGTPIGTEAFVQKTVAKTVHKIWNSLQALADVGDPQSEMLLLRACVGYPKIVFHIRCNSPFTINEQIAEFDSHINDSLDRIIGYSLTHAQREQSSLPFSRGGYGIPIALDLCHAAYAASVAASMDMQVLLGCFTPHTDFDRAKDTLVQSLTNLAEFDLNDFNTNKFDQHSLKVKLDQLKFDRLLSIADARGKALLNGRCMQYANGWLFGVPSEWLGSVIEPTSYRCLLKYHLGIPLSTGVVRCNECHALMDDMGDHAISCATAGDRIAKHDTLVCSLAESLRKANISVKTELGDPNQADQTRPGDLVLLNWREGQDLYLDFSVASTLAPSYRALSSRKGGGSAEERVKFKLNKYKDVVVKFEPLVVESLGGWAESAIPLFKRFATRISEVEIIDPAKALARLLTSMSFRLQKLNGNMLAKRHCGPLSLPWSG